MVDAGAICAFLDILHFSPLNCFLFMVLQRNLTDGIEKISETTHGLTSSTLSINDPWDWISEIVSRALKWRTPPVVGA